MSQENVEAYKRAIEAFNRRDLDTILALAHEEVVVEPRFAAMEGGHRGHDGVRRWWENLLEVLPDFQLEVGKVRDLGEVTLARIHARGHGAGSAAPLDEVIWQVGRWRNGKYTWWRNCMTEAEALEAAGVSQ